MRDERLGDGEIGRRRDEVGRKERFGGRGGKTWRDEEEKCLRDEEMMEGPGDGRRRGCEEEKE